MREIVSEEVDSLMPCLKALAVHHSEISKFFKDRYISQSYMDGLKNVLQEFYRDVSIARSHIAVVEADGKIVGFVKVDISDFHGHLDYLIVLPEYRGRGFGGEMMDWAMAQFKKRKITDIDIKVIYGNPTLHLYEKYGFRPYSVELRYKA